MERKEVFDIVIWYSPDGSETLRTRPLTRSEYEFLHDTFLALVEGEIEGCWLGVKELRTLYPKTNTVESLQRSPRVDFLKQSAIKKISIQLVDNAETKHKGRPRPN